MKQATSDARSVMEWPKILIGKDCFPSDGQRSD
jgi:hypothetical protein